MFLLLRINYDIRKLRLFRCSRLRRSQRAIDTDLGIDDMPLATAPLQRTHHLSSVGVIALRGAGRYESRPAPVLVTVAGRPAACPVRWGRPPAPCWPGRQ